MIEVIIAAAGGSAIISAAVFSLWFALFGYNMLMSRVDRKNYPVEVPGWKTLLNSIPPFDATEEDVAKMNELMLKYAVEIKGYKKRAVKAKLNNLRYKWVKFDPTIEAETEGKADHHIRDTFGRIIAGDHDGDYVRAIYRQEYILSQTAAFHEAGHEIHELEKTSDMKHTDALMWGSGTIRGVVSEAKADFAAWKSAQKED